ncbi:uncharacterized protein B0T23DRAFT_394826 [Neurospora hispaniola]|uniref:Uncharacterized protein n=1 Tax=Neurospora hispaniola TaxID=588809 RepID=A0AAJ0I9Z6_9PEZI|nr:hypothetical protein B0T23DRAFT_394826 [Neurospora hispaniola]
MTSQRGYLMPPISPVFRTVDTERKARHSLRGDQWYPEWIRQGQYNIVICSSTCSFVLGCDASTARVPEQGPLRYVLPTAGHFRTTEDDGRLGIVEGEEAMRQNNRKLVMHAQYGRSKSEDAIRRFK